MSMIRILTGTAAAGCCLVLAACGSDSDASAAAAGKTTATPATTYDATTVKSCMQSSGATISDGPADVVVAIEDATKGVWQATYPSDQEIDVGVTADQAELDKIKAGYVKAGGSETSLLIKKNIIAEVSSSVEPAQRSKFEACLP
jgi:hypothetical protein